MTMIQLPWASDEVRTSFFYDWISILSKFQQWDSPFDPITSYKAKKISMPQINNLKIIKNPKMSSKKQRKKQKAAEKGHLLPLIPQKLHYEEYQIPPYCQDHLRALFLQYISRGIFPLPAHHENIMAKIRSFYQNIQNSDIYMKDLALEKVIRELVAKGVVRVREFALGTKLVLLVENFDVGGVGRLAGEYRGQRPVVAPPDPIAFQQQKALYSEQQKQYQLELKKALQGPSLFGKQITIESLVSNHTTFEQKGKIDEFKTKSNTDYCDHCTRDKCLKINGTGCQKRHFRAIITSMTDESMGNCPHLNACHNPDCKHIHYIDEQQKIDHKTKRMFQLIISQCEWINCDMRTFDFTVLGKFQVVMADPPWDIHMNLPYGTMKDKEMLNLRVDLLQDHGVIFLWVTGRAMELGRECLIKWGYSRVDEIVWIKTNQLHRLIITGKTGHWLNHSKEHCLVGIKGKPKIRAKLDCDVIVSQVRETSRKPDQIYGLIERMCPGGKKIQLFGRPQNCMPGWLTLGNQLPGVRLKHPDMIERYRATYPEQNLTDEKMKKNAELMNTPQNYNLVYNNHILKNN